jgi:hypothetical protein
MDSKGDEFFQTAIWGTPPNERTHTQRLDLVIGSGGKGQTYLFWDDHQLFQLPVGYSTVLGQWINSPGYKDGTASFDRGYYPAVPGVPCHLFRIAILRSGRKFLRHEEFRFGYLLRKVSWAWKQACGKLYIKVYGSPGGKNRKSSKAPTCKAGGRMRTVPWRPGRTLPATCVYIRARTAAGPVHRPGTHRFGEGCGRSRQAGEAINKEPVLPDVEDHDLLDVPRCAPEGAGPRGHVAALLELP